MGGDGYAAEGKVGESAATRIARRAAAAAASSSAVSSFTTVSPTKSATEAGGEHTVNVAILGNLVVTLSKFTAFLFTSSGAMLAESVHSLADTMNQVLLRIGIMRSKRPATVEHPYGFASEKYVWGLMSGVGVFFLGCGVTMYHGVASLFHPQEIISIPIALGVLGASFLVEGWTLGVSIQQVRQNARLLNFDFWEYVRSGPDPIPVAVMMEDSASVLGVGIAAASLTATHLTDNAIYDAMGSCAVASLLGLVAAFLIKKNSDFLLSKSIKPERVKNVVRMLWQDDVVRTVHSVKAVRMGSEEVRFKAEINFNGHILAERIINQRLNIGEFAAKPRTRDETTAFLVVFGDQLVDLLGDEIDRLEGRIREHIPEAVYVDIEVV